MLKEYEVLAQLWVKCEGLEEKLDGFSLHISQRDAECFVKNYRNNLPAYMPDEYSVPRGELSIVTVDEQTYTHILKGKFGARFDRRPSPNGSTMWTIRIKK